LKTNQYNMPLLHFAGVYPSNARKGRTFSIGFCFLPSEKEIIYQWAVTEFQKAVYGDQFNPRLSPPITRLVCAMLSQLCGLLPHLSFAGGI